MSCTTCYQTYISCGVDDIVLRTGIEGVAEYTVIITHPNGAKYKYVGNSDAFGDITIPIDNFPLNMFNPYAGIFSLHIDTGTCDDFLFCDYYKYIEFEVRNGNEGKNTLSCCPPGGEITPGMTCCTTTTQNFVNESVTTVPYTGTRPTIEVAYLNNDGTFTIQGIGGQIIFNTTEFIIDHGGPATGVVKILK